MIPKSEVGELSENSDNVVKLISDAYSVRNIIVTLIISAYITNST